jgi:TrmH family RNA methyltransferase
MIPLYKLEKLPRTQKLRKIAKVYTMAEKRLYFANEKVIHNIFSSAELVFFTEACKLLAKDPLFPPPAKKIFEEASPVFEHGEHEPFLRALNSVKHLLLSTTGRDQADWDFTGNDGRLDPAARQVFEGMHVYMEDIRSPFNVGAMFRTAESFGVEKIILSPFCADPRHSRSLRTAMGCVDIVPWERGELPPCPVFALETGGTPITEFSFPRKGLLIAGSEELGVSPRALEAADASLGRVSIPCYGAKASLNVSVAFGIALQAWANSLKT